MSEFGSILIGLGLRALIGKMSEKSSKKEIQIYEEAWDTLFSPEISALLNMMTETLTKQIGEVELEWEVVKKALEWSKVLKGIIWIGITDYTAFEATFYAITDIVAQEYPDMATALMEIRKYTEQLAMKMAEKMAEELRNKSEKQG